MYKDDRLDQFSRCSSLRGRRKKGRGRGEGERENLPPLFSFLPIPYPLPLSTPATQATAVRESEPGGTKTGLERAAEI